MWPTERTSALFRLLSVISAVACSQQRGRLAFAFQSMWFHSRWPSSLFSPCLPLPNLLSDNGDKRKRCLYCIFCFSQTMRGNIPCLLLLPDVQHCDWKKIIASTFPSSRRSRRKGRESGSNLVPCGARLAGASVPAWRPLDSSVPHQRLI